MNDNNWSTRAEPFSTIEQYETEEGMKIEEGQEVLVKPKYIRERLPAMVEKIYWDPQGLPGGQFDHRGEVVSKPDYGKENPGEYEYERPDQYDCILKVQFRFDVPKSDEYSHMDGKTVRYEGYNLDFCVGETREITR